MNGHGFAYFRWRGLTYRLNVAVDYSCPKGTDQFSEIDFHLFAFLQERRFARLQERKP